MVAVVERGALLRPIMLEQNLSGVAAVVAVLMGRALAAFLLLVGMAGLPVPLQRQRLGRNPAAVAAAQPLEPLALVPLAKPS
jgi:hypothetical protein